MKDAIIGFDPGGTTGYCVAYPVPGSILGFDVVRCNVIQWNDRIPAIRAILNHYLPKVILVEDFVLYASKAKDMVGKRMQSAEVIGIIRTYLYELSLPDPQMRMASTISRTEIPRAHLSVIPSLSAEQKEHAMDSYKHVRHYIVSQRVAAARKATKR